MSINKNFDVTLVIKKKIVINSPKITQSSIARTRQKKIKIDIHLIFF